MAAKRSRRKTGSFGTRVGNVFIAHGDASNPEIGRRLKLLRKYLKLSQRAMAAQVGVTGGAWNQ